jgi:hypothetical protein
MGDLDFQEALMAPDATFIPVKGVWPGALGGLRAELLAFVPPAQRWWF